MRSRFSNATGKIYCYSTTTTESDHSILFAGTADVGTVDPPVIEPQPTASKPEKPVATRPRTRSAIKKTNTTRQTKRKGAVTSEPKPVAPNQTTPITLSNHAEGDGSGSGSGPAVVPSTRAAKKKKVPRVPRQGTRFSARLRGQNPTATCEPTMIEPKTKNKQTKRKRESNDEDNATKLPKKSAKRANDQTDTPVQVGVATPSGDPPADPVPSDDVTADHPEQPPDVDVGEGSTVADPPEDEPAYRMRFFLDKENGRTVIKLGYVPVDSSL